MGRADMEKPQRPVDVNSIWRFIPQMVDPAAL